MKTGKNKSQEKELLKAAGILQKKNAVKKYSMQQENEHRPLLTGYDEGYAHYSVWHG